MDEHGRLLSRFPILAYDVRFAVAKYVHMRILKIVQAYEPFREKGGAVVNVRAIAHGLAKRGHSVTVMTADLGLNKRDASSSTFVSSRWGREAQHDGVRAIYLRTLASYRALTWNPVVGRVGKC